MKIERIRVDESYIYGIDASGKEYSQSLVWYPRLKVASDEERAQYKIGYDGIHWRNIDEDVSFESFLYDPTDPNIVYHIA